jgi:hypothetical protein
MALKMSSKTAIKIKKMLQTYAIARPTVRLFFKVFKSKNDTRNWVYGPTPNANIADAASKVCGSDVAAQCILGNWPNSDAVGAQSESMATATDGESSSNYKIVAYLPSPQAGKQLLYGSLLIVT